MYMYIHVRVYACVEPNVPGRGLLYRFYSASVQLLCYRNLAVHYNSGDCPRFARGCLGAYDVSTGSRRGQASVNCPHP